jgi:hypothetical protein
MSSDGESIFLTQNKFKDDDEQTRSTDGILSEILDLESENVSKQPNFDLKVDGFSDISDEEILVNATQCIENKENAERFVRLNQGNLNDLVKKRIIKENGTEI